MATSIDNQNKALKKAVKDEMRKIAKLWCLIRFVTLAKLELDTEYWRKSLESYMTGLAGLCDKNDSTKSTRKQFEDVLTEDGYNKTEEISRNVRRIFIFYSLDIYSKEYKQVLANFKDSVDFITSLIIYNDNTAIKEYVNNL